MAPRDLPNVSGLTIAPHGQNPQNSNAELSSGHPDSMRGSERTVLDSPQQYEQYETFPSSDEEDGRYEEPHRSAGFWDPAMKKIRGEVIFQWARMLLILSVFIIAVLSLYWAVLFHVDKNMRTLKVLVVDFDGQVAPYDYVETPVVGPLVTEIAQEMFDVPTGQRTLGYTVVSPEEYGNDPIAVRQAVYDWHAWAAIIINANATALLQQAVAMGNASYDPTGAVQFIIQSARQETNTANYITPQLQTLSRQFTARFGPAWSASVAANSSLTRENLAAAAAAVNPGVTPMTIDLRPFGPTSATPSVTIGLIYLIIVAFFSYGFFLPIHMQFVTPGGHPPLRFFQLIVWRIVSTMATYLFVSLTYSFVSLAFQIPFWPEPGPTTEPAWNPTAYGRGSFPVYWMVNFVGMNALGFACENVAMIIGQPWTAAWLIFWVITNVSTSFYSLELAPGFFKWGYAWPLHHIVQASRQILFDLHSEIGLNFGVLFAWCAINLCLFPFCCYVARWKMERERRAAERAAESYAVFDAAAQDQRKHVPKEKGTLPPVRKRGFMRGV